MHLRKYKPFKNSEHPYQVTIFAIFLIKIATLIYWGPGLAPDSGGYLSYAEKIVYEKRWMVDAGLETSAMPITAFRAIGYPAFLALAQLIFGDFWNWIVATVQILVSLISLFCISRLCKSLGINPLLGSFALFAIATSFSLTLDQMILTDSIVASAFIIILSENAVRSLSRQEMGCFEALVFGLLLALAFSFREGVMILSVLFLIPLLVRMCLADSGKLKACSTSAIFFAPMLISAQLLISWNEMRTGDRFVTTGGQTVYLQGLMDAFARDSRIFDGVEPLDLAAQRNFDEFVFSEVLAIQGELFDQGYQAPDIENMVKQKYLNSWLEYPVVMGATAFGHFRGRFPSLSFRPIASLRETGLWVTHKYPWPAYGDLRSQVFKKIDAFILFASESLERLIGITIWVFFVFSPVIWIVRIVSGKSKSAAEALVCGALWTVYMGLMAAHLLVHIESRYFAPVIPFSILIGLLGLQKFLLRDRPKLRVADV